jgi:hypothetical protein
MLNMDSLLQKIELLEEHNALLKAKIEIMEKRQEASTTLIKVYQNIMEEMKASYDNGNL